MKLDQYAAMSTEQRITRTGKEVYDAFLDGALQAMQMLGHTCPYEEERLRQSWVVGEFIRYATLTEKRVRENARMMIERYGYDKEAFRGMVFDRAHINDNGIATDAMGNEIEDSQYRVLPGKSHEPWPDYVAVHDLTDERLEKAAYLALPTEKQVEYCEVRYMEIRDNYTHSVYQVEMDDVGMIKEMIADDIRRGDPITWRYLAESGKKLWPFRNVIVETIRNLEPTGHTVAITPMLLAQVRSGVINDAGRLNIAALQSLCVAVKPSAFMEMEEGLVRRYARMVEAAGDQGQFEMLFPDEDILAYRDVNGRCLQGLRRVIEDWVVVSREELAKMDDAERLQLQKNWIRHRLLPRAAAKLQNALAPEQSLPSDAIK